MSSDPALPPRVWVLAGAHRGDNNQLLALADALGWPYETKELAYNDLRRLHPRLLGWTLRSLTPEARASIAGEPPDLCLSIGHRSVPVARALKRRSRRRIKSIHLGNPRVSPIHFDLVITTPQYPVPDRANVLRLPIALGRPLPDGPPSQAASRFLADLPEPRRLLLLGGPTRFWTLAPEDVAVAVTLLLRDASAAGGSLIVLPSPRTPPAVLHAAERALSGVPVPATLAPLEGPPSYAELLAAADRLIVTADSVSMVSEALKTGKPVGLVPIRKTWPGKAWMRLWDRLRPGRPVYPRDLRAFWAELERQRLAGTVEAPGGGAPDVMAMAVDAVRRLWEPQAPRATISRDGDRSG
jgi:mitochondrial fission protein ELM1